MTDDARSGLTGSEETTWSRVRRAWSKFWCPFDRSGPGPINPWMEDPYCTCGQHDTENMR